MLNLRQSWRRREDTAWLEIQLHSTGQQQSPDEVATTAAPVAGQGRGGGISLGAESDEGWGQDPAGLRATPNTGLLLDEGGDKQADSLEGSGQGMVQPLPGKKQQNGGPSQQSE